MEWIQQVNFEKEIVADMIAVERNALDEGDMSNEGNLSLVHVAAVANREGMVDG